MNSRLAGIDPSLYFITDSRQCAQAGRSVAETAAAAVAGGAGMVQIRDKILSDEDFHELACEVFDAVQAVAGDRRVPIVVNDRVAVAERLLAQGREVHIHVGQEDTPAETVRRRLGEVPLIGLSAATEQEFAAAGASGAVDLLGVGPVFDTTTKSDAPAALGIAETIRLVRLARLPAVAIGGINRSRARGLRDTGVM